MNTYGPTVVLFVGMIVGGGLVLLGIWIGGGRA